MTNRSAHRTHQTNAGDHSKALVKMIQGMSYGRHTLEVFSDFIELSALSISNAVDRAQFDGREQRYMQIIGKYKPDEVAQFPAMLAELVMSFEDEIASGSMTDVLGSIYMMLELGNERAGQFFTPFHISQLMAGLLVGDGAHVREKGFLQLHEPACGAGGMVIAYAHALQTAGLNYQQAMHAICVDIDNRCVHMTYLQLALLHIPGIVVHGNALSMEEWSHWYTPAHVLGGWKARLRRERESRVTADVTEPDATSPDERAPATTNDTSSTQAPAIDFGKLEQLALF